MSFASLGLSEPILRAVSERGYTQPTPIQTQAIPAVLAGGDLLAGAQTGTGKTAGFTLPMLERLSRQPAEARDGRAPIRALVLVPTRELAAQVEESIRAYGRHLDIRSMVMFGGVAIGPQISRLRERVDILVATPGRLLDHVQQKTVELSRVEILVLDEADRMLDMGFIHDIRKVLALLPRRRQNLLFSATFPDEIRELADTLLHRPAMIEVARRNAPAELVDQKVVRVERGHKAELLAHLIRTRDWHQVLVFTRTKHRANWLAEKLEKAGITALAIHGNKSQNARTRALKAFRDGELRVLVATDIAARGLDIVELPHVVNFEIPNVPEDYVHRIGRTGRAGLAGEALSLVSGEEAEFLAGIEKLLKRSLPSETIADFVPSAIVTSPESEERPPRALQPSRSRPQGGQDRAPPSERPGKPGGRRGQRAQKPATADAGAQRRNGQGRDGGRAGGTQRKPRRDGRPRYEEMGATVRIGEGGEVDGNVLAPGWKRDANGNLIPPPPPRDPDGNRKPLAGNGDGKTATGPASADRAMPRPQAPRGESLKRRFGELRNAAAALLGRGRRDEI